MMSSEEDTECFGLYDKLLINTTNSKKGLVVAGNSSLNINNSNSNSSSSSNSNSSSNNNKRNRQRVDAGEPRNSYSSIPNFSSRPTSFMSSASAGVGGLYGALLNQTQSAHFVGGLFGPNGFGSAKMLNELFGRQMKQAQDATSGLPTSLVDNAMLAAAMESATSADLISASLNASLNSSKLVNNNCIVNSNNSGNSNGAAGIVNSNSNNDSTSSNSSPDLTTGNRRTSSSDRSEGGGVTPPQQQQQQQKGCTQQQQNDLAHHMLRNILQGKKDLMALDQELRSVINQHNNSANLNSNGSGSTGSDNAVSQDNNNCIGKNKNNNSYATNNNNSNASSNRNIGNNCESRSTSDISTKVSNTNSASANMNSNIQSPGGVLMNTLGVCSELKIKCEPSATITPKTNSNIKKSICVGNTASNNNSTNNGESSDRGSRSSTDRRKSTDDSRGNTDVIICLGDGPETEEYSECNDDVDCSEIHQVQKLQQSECQSTPIIGKVITKKEADDILEDQLMVLNSRSDIESLGSPSHSEVNDVILDSSKEELDEELEKHSSVIANKPSALHKPVVVDMKRARVENIVSSMRSSPSSHHHNQPHLQVNGCKKRKLYQPQQHAMERYVAAAAGLNFGLNMQSLMLEDDDDDEIESPQIQQKRVEKNALKSQLRSMQEQLAEMQQKYVQLCSRMEQESECQEVDDTASDSMEPDDNPGDVSPSLSLADSNQMKSNQRALSTSPPLYPVKSNKNMDVSTTVGNNPHMLSHMMSKMMTSKLHNPIGGHSQMQQAYNPPHPLLQHIPQVPGDHSNPHMPHTAISNAAAMYLGQQFLLEQEARLAKEAAEENERQQQQQHESQRRFEQEQQEAQQRQKEHQQQQQQQQQQQKQQHQQMQQQRQQQANSLQHQQQQQQHQQQQQQQQHQQQQQLQQHQQQQLDARQVHVNSQSTNPPVSQSQRSQIQSHAIQSVHPSIKSEISEKFNMLRSHSSSVVRMSGSDLEGLADVLKSEITTSLSALVDTIVTRFVHQRRLYNKQSQSVAAAAEQLNKDLLMASQILDRKSPRTKVADQSSLSSITINTSAGIPSSSQSGNNLLLNSSSNQTMSTNSSICNISSTKSSNSSSSLLTNHLTCTNGNNSSNNLIGGPRINGSNVSFASPGMQMHHAAVVNGPQNQSDNSSSNNSLNIPPPHVRPSPSAAIFQAPKTPQSMNPVAAAALYNSMNALSGGGTLPLTTQMNPFCMPEPRDQNMEQNEALSLVVTPKKKRHKVTDTRITPRTVSRILAQDGVVSQQPSNSCSSALESNIAQNISTPHNKFLNQIPVSSTNNISAAAASTTPSQSPSPRSNQYHPPPPPPPMMPVSLPTTVAIPNPSLHESQVFSPYSPFFNPHHGPHGPHGGSHAPPSAAQIHHMKMSSSPPGLGGIMDTRDSPPLPHPPTMLHPALLAAAHHGNSPDYSAHLRAAMDAQDRNSDCNSAEMQFDGIQPTISFLKQQMIKSDSLTPLHSSTLTPMHLRKAKLMFFWVRYPSSAVLKMYFPDIKFNKNNTAQLVKWFSNFREFYYIQMEKYARQAVTEGVKNGEDLHVGGDSELYRVLNLHYNRNNHIEVPSNFRFVVEQTLREFFRAIQGGKDTEQSWKKSIYKIISRMDDPVPEYFKSPNFLEQLE